ncbi:adenosylcobalamin-dependent ribonucleoside-diphosphate reductase [Patescibacteria group bacterium]|nr:adenosylcobalamin-dependent ribonucleoside-diphosphate reductase [Patescibacteria group bacterium]MBU1868241.1 adenosylcobalamin-dependent ribonucleoside-diphosphate reductase [Patescibacteria group bacterium]
MRILFKKVIKRSGIKQDFSLEKIFQGIFLAAQRVGGEDEELARKVAEMVIDYLSQTFPRRRNISTQDIGDAVEKVLIEEGHAQTAKSYILYRDEQRRKVEKQEDLGVSDDLGGLTYNGLFLLKKRYLLKDEEGNTIETPKGMIRRVAMAVAAAEQTKRAKEKWEKKFVEVMESLEFWPGTRVLANAGKEKQQMGNCFVFPISDSVEDIFQVLYESSVTKKNGGGCGYNFSMVRPRGDQVGREPSLASGPLKIMQLFDATTRIFRQQGRYESGNMAILNADHPDILDFITAKEKEGVLISTNISLGVSDRFMEAVKYDRVWELINPRTHKVASRIRAKVIFDLASRIAHQTGDPGLLFLDTINRGNPLLDYMGPIVATNVCGEQPLYPYECCNLGYLNLTKFLVRDKGNRLKLNYDRLIEVVKVAVRMLDDTIDVTWFPVARVKETVLANRRVGLGLFGWAEVLARLSLPYDNEDAVKLAKKVMKHIYDAAWEASFELAEEKGPFPNVKYSIWKDKTKQPRNIALTTLPPSSNHAIIMETSFGIEPFFALAYRRNAFGGNTHLFRTNGVFRELLEKRGIHQDELLSEVAKNHGSVQAIKRVPDDLKRIFKTAHDISYKDHVKMQAAFQRWTDNSVTKTINMPNDATPVDVGKAYLLAWEMGCKGVTIYRDRSRQTQVIEFGG